MDNIRLVTYVKFIFRITSACRGPFNTKLPITACQCYATTARYAISHTFGAYEYCWLHRVYIRVFTNMCILPSKTQHMYINALMKYQLHQGMGSHKV